MKTFLPWLCVTALLIGLGGQYASNRKRAADMAQLREDCQELQKLRAAEQARTAQTARAENEELLRLRKDHEDLLRVRDEIRQLRNEQQQLVKQIEAAAAPLQQQPRATNSVATTNTMSVRVGGRPRIRAIQE